jgi:hypothetical protein
MTPETSKTHVVEAAHCRRLPSPVAGGEGMGALTAAFAAALTAELPE